MLTVIPTMFWMGIVLLISIKFEHEILLLLLRLCIDLSVITRFRSSISPNLLGFLILQLILIYSKIKIEWLPPKSYFITS